MLKTKKPNVDAFIAGAKADAAPAKGKAKAARPAAKPAAAAAEKPAEGKGRGRGKEPSLFMPPVDAEDIRRYQVRMPEPVHREIKSEAARLGLGIADFILVGALEKAGREEGKRRGLDGAALEAFVEAWKAERTVIAYRAKGLPY